jgi:hypothetical protein
MQVAAITEAVPLDHPPDLGHDLEQEHEREHRDQLRGAADLTGSPVGVEHDRDLADGLSDRRRLGAVARRRTLATEPVAAATGRVALDEGVPQPGVVVMEDRRLRQAVHRHAEPAQPLGPVGVLRSFERFVERTDAVEDLAPERRRSRSLELMVRHHAGRDGRQAAQRETYSRRPAFDRGRRRRQ